MRYRIEPRDKYFQVFCHLPEREIRPGVTVTFSTLVDITEIEAIREEQRRSGVTYTSYTAFVARAVALALKKCPYANRRVFRQPWRIFRGPQLQSFTHSDVGVAAERFIPGRESIAFVDVIRDADHKSLSELTEWLQQLATADEERNLQWREFNAVIRRFPWPVASLIARLPVWFPGLWQRYRGAAVLISSPAKYGVDNVAATWAWPLGVSFGYVAERPVVIEGCVKARPTFNFIINFDRRVMAGAQAAQFFAACIEHLTHARSLSSNDRAAELSAPHSLDS